MPAPLLGPNSTNPHGQPETQQYIYNDTTSVTPGTPVVIDNSVASGKGAYVVLGATAPAALLAGIALENANKGDYVTVEINGPVKAKTVATPALNAALQLDAGGAGLTTKSTGLGAGTALEVTTAGFATVFLRLSS